jgi:hypothetical protein
MNYAKGIANFFRMSESSWQRHANPLTSPGVLVGYAPHFGQKCGLSIVWYGSFVI